MTLLSVLMIGFVLGMKHATESDHLAAVATLTSGRHSLPAGIRLGVAWGIGHTTTLLLVGAVVLALGTTVPEHLERMLELLVGIMLVLLGVDVIARVLRRRIHLDLESAIALDRREQVPEVPFRALVVGMVHGLAGSAALVLLSLQTVRSVSMGIVYILVFGLGSVAGMAMLSLVIAVPLQLSRTHAHRWHRGATALIGAATFMLGAYTIYHIAIIERLWI